MLRTSVATQSGDWKMDHKDSSVWYSSSVWPGQCCIVGGVARQPWMGGFVKHPNANTKRKNTGHTWPPVVSTSMSGHAPGEPFTPNSLCATIVCTVVVQLRVYT
jgi:hypothetical protein